MENKLAAVVAVELPQGERETRVDVPEGIESPAMGLVEEGMQANPARGDIGSDESKDILAGSGLSAVMDGVNLDKTGQFPFLGGVKGADGDTVFEEPRGFGEGFAFEGGSGPVIFEGAVDSSRAYPHQLLSHEGREQLPALIPKKRPDQAQGGDDIVGVDFFALPVGRPWFGGFEFDGPALREEEGLRLCRFIEKAQGVLPVFVPGNADEFVQYS
jgi:hypothetical protein